jgi:hypothetical protein
VIRTDPAACTAPTWPGTWPCDYCGAPVTPARGGRHTGDGTIYRLLGAWGAWHDACRDCLGETWERRQR